MILKQRGERAGGGMAKNERIAENKREIEALEDQVAELTSRIAMLEARPIMPWMWPVAPLTPTWTGDNTGTVCTCGVLTGICPVHGGLLGIADTAIMTDLDLSKPHAWQGPQRISLG